MIYTVQVISFLTKKMFCLLMRLVLYSCDCRYCLSINVLVSVYSLFQIFVQIFWKIKKKWIMSRPVSYYFNLSMDQASFFTTSVIQNQV